MVQTDRRAETARQTSREQERTERRPDREAETEAALALQAILSGGSWEQLPSEGVLALSHGLGNSALLEVVALRQKGPEAESARLPGGESLTGPMDAPGGAPLTAPAPDFGALSPLGALAPMEA